MRCVCNYLCCGACVFLGHVSPAGCLVPGEGYGAGTRAPWRPLERGVLSKALQLLLGYVTKPGSTAAPVQLAAWLCPLMQEEAVLGWAHTCCWMDKGQRLALKGLLVLGHCVGRQ